jgi:molybdopterin converting factor small subunit
MKVVLKLYASLSDYLPAEARQNQVQLDVEDGATVGTLIERYRLPPKLTHLVLVNGVFVEPAARGATALREGDQLAVWPPIAGG